VDVHVGARIGADEDVGRRGRNLAVAFEQVALPRRRIAVEEDGLAALGDLLRDRPVLGTVRGIDDRARRGRSLMMMPVSQGATIWPAS
jgi:hypothetical protein